MARLLMVISSLAPLFLLLAIRGSSLIPDGYFIGICALLIVLPISFLLLRIRTAKKNNDLRHLTAGTSEDSRNHVLVYLFVTLLPFYRQEVANDRDLWAILVALAFIVFLFWRLNLHYMNIFFAFRNYQIFTVTPPEDDNPHSGREKFVLITRRPHLLIGDHFHAYRISNTVYLEKG